MYAQGPPLEKHLHPDPTASFADLGRLGSIGADFSLPRGQVGLLIKKGGIPGVKARKVIPGGMARTGGVTRSYIAYKHSSTGAKSVYDGYFPMQSAVNSYTTPILDLDVPVVEVQGERELIDVRVRARADHIVYRRPDGPLYRLYEVAGMPHVQTRGSAARTMWAIRAARATH